MTHRPLAVAIAIACSLSLHAQIPRPCKAPTAAFDPAPALNYPDQYVWQLFLQVSAKAPTQTTFYVNGLKYVSNDAVWETWADDPYTFPAKPNPADPPAWPGDAANRGPKRLMEKAKAGPHPRDPHGIADGLQFVPVGNDVEEVRRNKATFDYVIQNGLWYSEGIAAFFASGQVVDFPIDAIEVKGNWIPIKAEDKSKYHWNYDAQGNLHGLVAMHLTSKALPNWIWATFEWVGNPGRCDFIGCRDCFGYAPSVTPSSASVVGGTYPGGAITPRLDAMFHAAGFTGEWESEWINYRLKGSQTDFTDASGVPLLVGNSVTEGGFVQTASCMTCHSRAAVDVNGKSAFPIFGEKEPLPLQTQSPQEFQTEFTTHNGPPDPNWFWIATGQGTKKLHMQTDFVWAIPFRAKPANPKN